MKYGLVVVLAIVFGAIPTALVMSWQRAAAQRLTEMEASTVEAPEAAVAAGANESYCSGDLKRILRRVLQSCGLASGAQGARGCQPVQAKSVATMSGDDFNALFTPMKERGGIIQFDKDASTLDEGDFALIDKVFADQQGASYFFVVSRASPEGSVTHNTELSQARAESVMTHLRQKFNDPDLDKEVGLLWLGEEFAQLDEQFCSWPRSGEGAECSGDTLNRSAFIAWIDCTL